MPDNSESDISRRRFLQTAGGGIIAAGMVGAASIPLAPPDAQPPELPIPGPAPKKTGYAIVGLGQLALEQVLPAFAHSEKCQPVALVSGHADKARKIADHYGIDAKNIYDYRNFDSIRDNPAVDVIYIILPNSMHAEYTVRGFAAGKHVLCEKPMAVTEQECQQMIDAGKKADRKLMIAYRLRYEPYNQTMIEMSRKQEYGPIRMIEAVNSQDVKAPNIRLSKKLGGGPLGDVGVYCLNAARYITGEEPTTVNAIHFQPTDDPRFAEVPDRVIFQLRFPSGIVANCMAGFSTSVSRRYRVLCQHGWLDLDHAFGYNGQRIHVGRTEGSENKEKIEEIAIPHVDHFAREMDHFADCVTANKQPLTPGEEGLADVRVMARIQESAESGKSVRV